MSDKQQIVGFQTVLRLRPSQKKERDDTVLLEPVPNAPNTVVLHPPRSNLLSPSSTLVRQTLSPEAVKITVDADYRFDNVLWPDDTNQDKLYFSHGLDMALSAMEPLKAPGLMPKNHLLVVMGASGSGKTYAAWGGSSVSTRKNEHDGMLPKLIDSLFSQSKHHVFSGRSKKKKHIFAVILTLLQVNQNQTKPQECQIHDLLQTPVSANFSIATATSAISTLSGASASLFGCSSAAAGHSPVIHTSKQVGGGSGISNIGANAKHPLHSSGTSNNYSHEEIFVEQDSVTSDFKVVNAHAQVCQTEVEARKILQIAWKNRARLSNNRRYQKHVYVTMQPVLLNRSSNKIVQKGGTVAILDMASFENPAVRLSKQLRGNRSRETIIPSVNDGHAAVMHCLSTLRSNQEVRQSERDSSIDDGNDCPHGDESSVDSNAYRIESLQPALTCKKVPYRQHKLTMLIQPLFGITAGATSVILIATTNLCHRDYAEKKALMDEIASFAGCTRIKVCTGLKGHAQSEAFNKITRPPCVKATAKRIRHRPPFVLNKDAEPGVLAKPRKKLPMKVDVMRTKPIAVAPGVDIASNSDSDDDFSCIPMPPPIAPSYMATMSSPKPSAPIESAYAVAESSLIDQRRGLFGMPAAGEGRLLPPVYTGALPALSNANYLSAQTQVQSVCGDARTIQPPMQAAAATVVEPPTPQDSYIFSPIRTINGMVHASKKKGKQVIEKISIPLPMTIKFVDNVIEKPARLTHLQENELVAINETLLEKNSQLQTENEGLRAALANRGCSERSGHAASCHRYDNESPRASSSSIGNSLIDSELLQYMAQMQTQTRF